MAHPTSDGKTAVFFGYGELALAGLEAMANTGTKAVAVCVPSNREGPQVEQIRAWAAQRGIPCLTQPRREACSQLVEQLRELRPDLILVWSYSMILPRTLLDVPRLGAVNLHGGLLPEYRGGHVMQWAIINGECESGMTLMYIDEGIDTGPVIAQALFPIEPDDDAPRVRDKLKRAGIDLIQTWLPAVAKGTAPRVSQDESRAKYYPLRTPEDGLIDWTQPSQRIINLIRALAAPWPGAFTYYHGRKIVVRRARLNADDGTGISGQVLGMDTSGLYVRTGHGCLRIESVEVDGLVAPPLELTGVFPGVGEVFQSTVPIA